MPVDVRKAVKEAAGSNTTAEITLTPATEKVETPMPETTTAPAQPKLKKFHVDLASDQSHLKPMVIEAEHKYEAQEKFKEALGIINTIHQFKTTEIQD